MTEIIRQHINRAYYNGKETSSRCHEDTRKLQALNEYLELDRSGMFRQPTDYVGLRKLNNGLLNCLLQVLFHVDPFVECLQRIKPTNKSLAQLRELLGQLQSTKFVFADAYDLHTKLKSLASEFIGFPEMVELLAQKVFAEDEQLRSTLLGTLTEYQDDMETIRSTESAFTSIRIDTKLRTFNTAFEAFKSRKTGSGTSYVEISKAPALLVFSLDRTANKEDFVFPMSVSTESGSSAVESKYSGELEEINIKIFKIEKLLEKQEFKQHSESLSTALRFLQSQEFTNIDDAGLGLADLSCNFGVLGTEESHEETKNRLRFYNEKLSRHEDTLKKSLHELIEKKAALLKQHSSGKYALLAVLFEDKQGSFSVAIYSERERKWRKMQDKRITEVPEAALKKEAFESAVGLIYRSQGVGSTPPHQRSIHEASKQAAVLHDYNLTKRMDQLRVERLLKSYSELAHDQIEYYSVTYRQNDMGFIDYFSTPLYQLLSENNIKFAELVSLTNYLKEPSFNEQLQRLLAVNEEISIPEFPIATAKDYGQVCTIVKTALLLESNCRIVPAVQLLAQCYSTTIAPKNTFLKLNCQRMLTLLLLKACFYLDLKAQTKQLAEVDTLVHNIMFVATMLPNGLDRQQITLNINNSLICLGKRPYDKYFADLTECNQLEQPNRKSIDDINVSRLLAKRFKLWIEFMTELRKTKAPLDQQYRCSRQALLFPEHL